MYTFESTSIEKDDYGSLWVYDGGGNPVCEAYRATADESIEDMLDAGYILVPYQFEGEDVFVEVTL